MTSRLHQAVSHIHTNQENAAIKAKTVQTNALHKPVKRGALGDLGNTLSRNCNETAKVAVAPQAIARKKLEVVRKNNVNKENTLKNAKENVDQTKKVVMKKPVRQESVILKKPVTLTTKVIDIKPSKVENQKESKIYDPDEKSRDDPLLVTEYTADILSYLRDVENQFPIKEKFLEDAKITSKMRATLVNWLVEVHMNFSLELDTLYLCISIVDRYLQVNKSVDRCVFQLVGTSALFLACKYEELYVPDISDFVYICDNAFKKQQVLQMEVDIVSKLDFRMGWPVAIYFLRRYSKVAQIKSEQYNLAKYILELALLEYSLAHIKPSIQAAAACCLSMAVISEVLDASKVWTPTLVHYSTYHYSDFKPVLYDFAETIVKAQTSKFDNVKQKYSRSKFGKISLNFKLNSPLIRKMTLTPILK